MTIVGQKAQHVHHVNISGRNPSDFARLIISEAMGNLRGPSFSDFWRCKTINAFNEPLAKKESLIRKRQKGTQHFSKAAKAEFGSGLNGTAVCQHRFGTFFRAIAIQTEVFVLVPIQLAWMVNQILGVRRHCDLLHHPHKADGV